MVSFDKTSRACLPLEFVRERMGGKGEKNYLAAHGGPARLPPPRDRSEQDALPSKLRVLMNYTSPPPPQGSREKERVFFFLNLYL